MPSDSIAKGRVQGALALAIAAMVVYAAASLLTTTADTKDIECKTAGTTCQIEVKVSDLGGFIHCRVSLNASVIVPYPKYDSIEWKVAADGFKFVDGGYAVSILNAPADFSAGSSSATSITLKRNAPTAPVYNYTLSLQSDSGQFCMVPTLPRIKNT